MTSSTAPCARLAPRSPATWTPPPVKTLLLLATCLSLSLSACATLTSKPPKPNADPFLQETKIEYATSKDCPNGPYETLLALMEDPTSTTRCLLDFAGGAEDALKRANDDKRSAREVLK